MDSAKTSKESILITIPCVLVILLSTGKLRPPLKITMKCSGVLLFFS